MATAKKAPAEKGPAAEPSPNDQRLMANADAAAAAATPPEDAPQEEEEAERVPDLRVPHDHANADDLVWVRPTQRGYYDNMLRDPVDTEDGDKPGRPFQVPRKHYSKEWMVPANLGGPNEAEET